MPRWIGLFLVALATLNAETRAGEAKPASSLRLTLPPVCYSVVGVPISLYYDNLVLTEKPEQYRFKVECDLGTTERRRWTVTPCAADVGDHPIAVSVSDAEGKVLQQGKLVLHVAKADAGAGRAIRLLIVGDSLTHATVYPNEIARLLPLFGNPAWTMLGTHRPAGAAKGVAHEGYGGWTWEGFGNRYLAKPDPTGKNRGSPFVFAVGGGKPALDLDHYFNASCGGQRPDFVTFLLGINDCFSANPEDPAAVDARIDAMFRHADKLVAAFRKAVPGADLGICLTTPPNARESGFEANYHGKYPRWGWKRVQHRLVERELKHFGGRESERIFLVPTELNLDPLDGYPENNGVHPNAVGYRQIGASIFAWIKSRLEAPREAVDLSGTWQFQLDPADVGIRERWFERALPQKVRLPGALQAQGFGDDVTVDTQWTGDIIDRSWFTDPRMAKYREPGHIKLPFWLQPDKHYVGTAWYRRAIEIPAAWEGRQGKHISLSLERCHWATRAWLDGRELGSRDSLSTPHVYDLGSSATPGKHMLTIRVDNRMIVGVGPNAHSVSDHTQSNWNGIVGQMELRVRDPIWIEGQRIFAANDGTVRIEVDVRNTLFDPVGGTITAIVRQKSGGKVVGKGSVRFDYPRGTLAGGAHVLVDRDRTKITLKLDRPPKLWSEFSPDLYESEVTLRTADATFSDTSTATFGFRQLGVQGTQFTLNGRKIFLRGTLECCIFPRTGYPPTDVESWRRIVRTCQAHGLNHIRFHSWCPPEAAFAAADELGFYIYAECAAWVNQGENVGDGKPIDRWIYAEGDRILEAYGNHPSFLLMSYGNEPAGRNQKRYLGDLVDSWKKKDGRRLYTSAAGWPFIPESQWHLTPAPRIQGWGEGLKSRINARPPETLTDYRDHVKKWSVPLVSHEIGQWCVYPNFDEIKKYTGYLKPRNFEIFRDLLEANHMGDQARAFLLASGKLQTLCYKEEIESALRTPGFGGFHLLDLHDFPGQGTALVGVLDPFWEGKGYVAPDEFRRFCNSTVPLARMAKRVWTTGETFSADIDVAHFGPAPLKHAVAAWKLVGDDGRCEASGKLPARDIPIDNGTRLGTVTVALKDVPPARKVRLVVGLEGTPFENDWDLWVFADRVDAAAPEEIVVCNRLDAKSEAALRAGKKVLLLAKPGDVASDVKIGFSSVFWNTAWTRGQAPHTLGILCDPKHPVFASFPTEGHSNWQWWELIHGSAAMILDRMPPKLRPLVQPIDTWFESRRLGLLFEARVAGGRLMACSMDLASDLDHRVVARQLRHSLLQYMASERFNPSIEVSGDAIRALLRGG